MPAWLHRLPLPAALPPIHEPASWSASKGRGSRGSRGRSTGGPIYRGVATAPRLWPALRPPDGPKMQLDQLDHHHHEVCRTRRPLSGRPRPAGGRTAPMTAPALAAHTARRIASPLLRLPQLHGPFARPRPRRPPLGLLAAPAVPPGPPQRSHPHRPPPHRPHRDPQQQQPPPPHAPAAAKTAPEPGRRREPVHLQPERPSRRQPSRRIRRNRPRTRQCPSPCLVRLLLAHHRATGQ